MRTEEINEIGAKAAAFQITQQYSFARPEEIILEDIAMARGVVVVEGPLEGAEARLIRKGEHGIIRVRENIPEVGRKRFAIAHELGHWELHPDISQMDLYSETGMKGYGSDPVEIEANIFASELLMPTKLYRPRCEGVNPNLQLISNLASQFQTSLTSAVVRFVEETDQSCAVVFSEDGLVTWWRKSDPAKGIWIDWKQMIRQGSLAWDLLKDKTVPEGGERVDAEAWMENCERYEVDKIFEQSIKLGHYPVILSLLWID